MNHFPAGIELGTVLRTLPSSWRDEGLVVAIQNAYAFGYADRLWSKHEAVHLLFLANMERAEGWGHGNKAAKRAAQIELYREVREQENEEANRESAETDEEKRERIIATDGARSYFH